LRIVLAYICVSRAERSADLAARFVSSYLEFPPGVNHESLVICNGGVPPTALGLIFSSLPWPRLWPRQNDSGWDVSGFMHAAQTICSSYDLMLCLGESVYFHRAGWLKRLVEAWEESGPGMYGPFGSFCRRAHLQTTAFCVAPEMFNWYREPVRGKKARYDFEHGENAFWRMIQGRGKPVRMVTWDGVWKPREWRFPENILWRGDQSNCLLRSNHTDNWDQAQQARKTRWSTCADSAFK